jgi:hypothetical protein
VTAEGRAGKVKTLDQVRVYAMGLKLAYSRDELRDGYHERRAHEYRERLEAFARDCPDRFGCLAVRVDLELYMEGKA